MSAMMELDLETLRFPRGQSCYWNRHKAIDREFGVTLAATPTPTTEEPEQ